MSRLLLIDARGAQVSRRRQLLQGRQSRARLALASAHELDGRVELVGAARSGQINGSKMGAR